MSNEISSFVEVKNVYKSLEEVNETILENISFSIEKGEFVSIMGPSGSGKSTLLGLLAGIDEATKGEIIIDGTDITTLNESNLCKFRNENMGIIFQSPNLIETLNAVQNIEVPLIFSKSINISNRSKELLDMVGLKDKGKCYSKQLSGGEAQRVAIARALACKPRIILADEPTGALDSKNGKMVIDILKNIAKEEGVTVIMVTHDEKLAKESDRIILISDGRLCNG